MSYKLCNESVKTPEELLQENIALKKEVSVLQNATDLLKAERDTYKEAYDRYSSFFIIKLAKKLLRKQL